MEQNITSSWTYFYKIFLPISFIPWTGFGRIKAALPPNDPDSNLMFWVFIAAWICIGAWVFWFAWRLKTVKMDGKYLHVSNFIKDTQIPLSDIAEIKESAFWPRPNHVVLMLKSPSEFGSKIVFIPRSKVEINGQKQSVIENLRGRIGASKNLD